LSVWDDTITASGQAVDFTSADFLRIETVWEIPLSSASPQCVSLAD
jgi:hypothetical protein